MQAKVRQQQQQQQGQRGLPPSAQRGGPQQLANADFLTRLERAEQRDSTRDSQRSAPSFGGITLTNWEQRSKNVAKLAIQNEMAEIAAKQRLGFLPTGNAQSPQAMPADVPMGYSQSVAKPNFRDSMELQRHQQQVQQQQKMMAQWGGGVRAPPQAVVPLGGGYDVWDDRVPTYLAGGAGGKVMNGREARQQSRGQSSSIVFG